MLRMKRTILFSAAILIAGGCSSARELIGFARQPEFKSSSSSSGRKGKVPLPPRILPETHYAAGRVFEQQGSPEKAIEQYRKAIAVNHEFPAAYARMGLMLSVIGQHDEAASAFEKAVAMKPENAVLRNNLGFELLYVERWDDAERHLREAVRLDPKLAHANINLGLLLGRTQRDEQAVASFRKSIPEPDAYYNLGLLQRAQARYAESAESFRKVLLMNPEFPAAQHQLTFVEQKIAAISKPQQPAVAGNIVEPKLNAADAKSIVDLETLINDLIAKPGAARTQPAAVPAEPKVAEIVKAEPEVLVPSQPEIQPATNSKSISMALEPPQQKPTETAQTQVVPTNPEIVEKHAVAPSTQPFHWDLNVADMARILDAEEGQRAVIDEMKNSTTPPGPTPVLDEKSADVVAGPLAPTSDEVVLVAAESQTRSTPELEVAPEPTPSPVRQQSWQIMQDMEYSLQILRNEVNCQKEHGLILNLETLNDSGLDLQHGDEWTPVRPQPDPARGTMLWDTQFKALDDWITHAQNQTQRAGATKLAQTQPEGSGQGNSAALYEHGPALYTPPVTAQRRIRTGSKEPQPLQPAESQPRE